MATFNTSILHLSPFRARSQECILSYSPHRLYSRSIERHLHLIRRCAILCKFARSCMALLSLFRTLQPSLKPFHLVPNIIYEQPDHLSSSIIPMKPTGVRHIFLSREDPQGNVHRCRHIADESVLPTALPRPLRFNTLQLRCQICKVLVLDLNEVVQSVPVPVPSHACALKL